MKTLKDVMTAEVEVVSPEDTLRECAEKLRALNVGSMPVVENGRLVGVITDRDIVVRAIAMGHDPQSARVRDAMTGEVLSLKEHDSLKDAAKLMKEQQVRRILVVDDDGRLCGIVSLGDVSQEAGERLSGETLEGISEPSTPAT